MRRRGATMRPVSSRTSRTTAAVSDSPISTEPPGSPHWPPSERCCRSKRPRRSKITAEALGRTPSARSCSRSSVITGTPYRTPRGSASSRGGEQSLELLPRHGRRGRHARVLLAVAEGFHPDQRGADARRRAHELQRALRVGGEPRQEVGDDRRQVLREAALI